MLPAQLEPPVNLTCTPGFSAGTVTLRWEPLVDGEAIEVLRGAEAASAFCSTQFPETLIEPCAIWSYFGAVEIPWDAETSWREPEFDDSAWRIGLAGFGFGDDDDKTIVDEMRDNFTELCLRHVFDIENPQNIPGLVLSVDYDDGFVAYLNGVEVARSLYLRSLPDDVPLTEIAGSSHEAGVPEKFPVSASHLRRGDNVLAIQAHNANLLSGDLSLSPALFPRVCHELLSALVWSWTSVELVRDDEVFIELDQESAGCFDSDIVQYEPGPRLAYQLRLWDAIDNRRAASTSVVTRRRTRPYLPPDGGWDYAAEFDEGDDSHTRAAFLGGAAPDCPDAADADDNGTLEISDGIRLLNWLFLGTESLPAPGAIDCGVDPSDDDLGVCRSTAC